MSDEGLKILSQTPLWSELREVATDQVWWRKRTEQLVGRELVPRQGNWARAYASLKKRGVDFSYKQDYGSSLIVPVLLELGADPRELSDLITRCVQAGNLSAVQLLLQEGSVKPRTHSLTTAIRLGYEDIAMLLLEDGRIDPSVSDDALLVEAITNGETNIARLIISRGKPHHTVITWAISLNRVEILQMLLEAGLDPLSDQDELIKAIERGSIEVSRMVLTYPIHQSTLHVLGNGCLEAAIRLGNMEIFSSVMNWYASYQGTDEEVHYDWDNNLPLRLARRYKRTEMEAILLSYPEVQKLDNEFK